MASDYDDAKEYIKDFFKEQEDIINAIATVTRDAIANFDAVSEIPEESSGWNWDVIATVLKATFKLAVTTVPQLRGLVLIYEATVAETKPAIDWVEKSTKKAKEFGLDPAKLIKHEAPKPPSVKVLKGTVVTARDGLKKWHLVTIEFVKDLKTHFIDEILPMLATKPTAPGRLKQAIMETLGPIPKFDAKKIDGVGVQFELDLYQKVYAKGVTIYITSPNRGSSVEQVRGLPGPILERVRALTLAPTDAQAISSWGVPRISEVCNSCHSPSRMNPPSRPGSVNTDWLIGTGGAGRVKDFSDPRNLPDLTRWLQQSSK
jgi:hypothetical protein